MINVSRYIINNKKRSLFTILGITISSILLISIGILFSSFRDYLIGSVKREIGDYHVIIKSDEFKDRSILKSEYKSGRNFIVYKDIRKVYKNTSNICENIHCESITYNDSLLSLYGLSKDKNILNTFKGVIYFLVIFLGIIIFFIIYNSFKVSLSNRKRDVSLFKLIGADNMFLYRFYFKESMALGIIGIFLGFLFSLILNLFLIKLINRLLYEIFNGNLHLSIYIPFLIIPILFMFLIIFLSSLMPLRNLKKYKAMELFRKKEVIYEGNIKPYKNFIYYLSHINFERGREKYKSLIICIFIFCLSINVFFLILKYGLKCLDEYVIMPDYDLSISTSSNYDLDIIAKDMKVSKKVIFNSCEREAHIPKKYFLNDYEDTVRVIVTDNGSNEIINKVEKIEDNGKIRHLKYKRFKGLDEIVLDGEEVKIDGLKLTDKVPFGFKEIEGVVVNLDKENFDKVCLEYSHNLILNTSYNGIDNYLDNLIRKNKMDMTYLNVKKAREITNNLVVVIKLFLYGVCALILMIMILSVINTSFSNIDYRRKEFASMQAFGLTSDRIILSLIIESLIISIKGFIYSVPFIFIINKYLFMSLKKIFEMDGMIIGVFNLILSFVLSFLCVSISMIVSHRSLKKQSLIKNIKENV